MGYRLLAILVCILYSVLCTHAYASDVECVGTATQVVNGQDTTFIFLDEIHLHSTVGPVNWYDAEGNEIATNTEDIYPSEGCYRVNNCHFCVQLYSGIDNLAFTVEPSCDATVLHVTGNFNSHAHTYLLSYNALAWNTEEWVDSAATQTGTLANTLYLPPLYGQTDLTLYYDTEVRTKLGLDSASVTVSLAENQVQAVKMELTSLATARGSENEKSNERNRPTSQTLITGSSYSGPLEVAFYSNPTPGAQFYTWRIYKASELLVTRHDKDIRYTFSEPSMYRVVCAVNNNVCASDSSEMSVSISESYLAVPNVFTPNGDGKNDEFRVAYRSLREFHIWVFNRWGKLVYESTDPAKGWDGTINGRPAAEGAYYYVVRALGTDAAKNAEYIGLKAQYKKNKQNGDEAVNGIYQLSGDINLLRGKKK